MISAVILTHNNEDLIGDVLETLQWCDERIIVDDNSTDKTLELVKPYDVTVIEHTLGDDFAVQRNIGLEKAKGEWVLFVDSDELVPVALQKEILKWIRQAHHPEPVEGQVQDDNHYVGYYISRKDFLFGRELKYGETAKVKLLRLAKKGAGKWIRAVHETWNVNGPVAYLTTPLLHYPHAGGVSEFLAQINRYTTINARVFYNEGKRVSSWQIITYPIAKFVQNYIIRSGFLDGTAGFVVAIMMSFHSFLTRGKLWELQQKNT